jgi:hypothetical protein
MKRDILLLSLILCFLSFLRAQEFTTISGRVCDNDTKESLAYATVQVVHRPVGTTTNRFGLFSFQIQFIDTVTVRFSYAGYRALEKTFSRNDPVLGLEILLTSAPYEIDQVEVVGSQSFYDTRSFPSSMVLQQDQLTALPAPGEQDLLRSLQRYPGITFNSEMSSSLYIRGETPDQTLILIDGMPVYNPSHVYGFFSMFNHDAIKAVKVMKGGFPADYGTRNGSVLDILSVDGDRNKFGGKASLGLVSSGLFLNGPVGEGSWMVSARRSYFDLVTSLFQLPSEVPRYYFYDIHARVSQNIAPSQKLSATFLATKDNLSLDKRTSANALDEYISSKWSNGVLGVEWSNSLSPSLFVRVLGSATSYNGNLDISQSLLLEQVSGSGRRIVNYLNGLRDFTAKLEAESAVSPENTLSTGVFATAYDLSYSTDASFLFQTRELRKRYTIIGGFVRDEQKLSTRFSLTPGVRLTMWGTDNSLFLEPRLVASYEVLPTILVKFGAGQYYQWLNGGQPASFLTFSGIDFWFPVDKSIPPSRSLQVSGDIVWTIEPSFSVTASVYASAVDHVVELKQNFEDSNDLSGIFSLGKARNRGFELLAERNGEGLTWMVGYTLSWADRKFDDIDNGSVFPARYDKRHLIDVVGGLKISKNWDLSFGWTYSSGQAYTAVLGYYDIQPLVEDWGNNPLEYILSKKNAYRLPAYHRLDLGLARTFNYESWKLRLRIDVFNVYSRLNALGANNGFTDDPYYRLLPIIPTAAVEAEF